LDLGGKRRLEDRDGIANSQMSEEDFENFCEEYPDDKMCGRRLEISNSTMENGKGKGGRGLSISNSTMENGKGKGGRGLEDRRDGIIESDEEDVDYDEEDEDDRRMLADTKQDKVLVFLSDIFSILDEDRSGVIDEFDIRHVNHVLDYMLIDGSVDSDNFFSIFDYAKDSKAPEVNFKEFTTVFSKVFKNGR